ncbi:MAG TPA: hypothetical protein P5531_03955 [Bacteroidales bacterium]|nr:hypothetical protein [Bacteroidales bacterium]
MRCWYEFTVEWATAISDDPGLPESPPEYGKALIDLSEIYFINDTERNRTTVRCRSGLDFVVVMSYNDMKDLLVKSGLLIINNQ